MQKYTTTHTRVQIITNTMYLLGVFILCIGSVCALIPSINTSNPQQYATVLAWDQFVPTESPESPFFGILYMTVTPAIINNANSSLNTYIIDTFLYHNVIYATDAGVWAAAGRENVASTMKIFDLFTTPLTASATDCPAYSTTMVFQDVIDALRAGLLFAQVTSGGVDAGQLRGQIETRNDIFFTSLDIYNASAPGYNITTVGAALIRTYDIHGYTFVDRLSPVGIDAYIISSFGVTFDVYGYSSLINTTAVDFGILVNTNSQANTIFYSAGTLIRRADIETDGPPVYGPGSSPMQLYMQDFGIQSNYTTLLMGNFIRLPLLSFNENDVFVFTQSGSSFGAGNPSSAAPISANYSSMCMWLSVLLTMFLSLSNI